MQTTIAARIEFRGVGLHSGAPARLVLLPAPPGHGLVFRRIDLPGRPAIPALWDRVEPGTRLNTRLVGEGGASVGTVEHLMAALAGAGVWNLRLELDGPELPILDGSAAPFLAAIRQAGVLRQPGPRRALRILAPVAVAEGEAEAALLPARGFGMDYAIDFADPAIGAQALSLGLAGEAFAAELADSRTFCRQRDVAAMQAQGLARGGTYFNAVVIEGDRVLSPGGLRRPDEAVRHKMLDAVGDLALAGGPILGRFTARRGGHALTNRLLRQLFATPGACAWVEPTVAEQALLPALGAATATPRPRAARPGPAAAAGVLATA